MDGLTSGDFAFVPHAHRFAILLHRVRRGRVVAVLGLEATRDVGDLVPRCVEVLADVEILDHAHWILRHGTCVLASLVVASSTRRIRHSLLCKSGVWSGFATPRWELWYRTTFGCEHSSSTRISACTARYPSSSCLGRVMRFAATICSVLRSRARPSRAPRAGPGRPPLHTRPPKALLTQAPEFQIMPLVDQALRERFASVPWRTRWPQGGRQKWVRRSVREHSASADDSTIVRTQPSPWHGSNERRPILALVDVYVGRRRRGLQEAM